MTYFKMIDSPLGKITLTSDGQNLTGLYFEKQKYSIDDHGYQQNLKSISKEIYVHSLSLCLFKEHHFKPWSGKSY